MRCARSGTPEGLRLHKTLLSTAGAAAVVLASCEDPTLFTSGLSEISCHDTIPSVCGQTAHCVIDNNHYLKGTFPGAAQFVLRTTGAETVTFEFLLDDRMSSGTQLKLTSTEPNCALQSTYDSMTMSRDIFQLAGATGILSFPIRIEMPGDHLVQFSSDAYCSFVMKYDTPQ
jgi:hypothetical protein